MTQSKGKAAGEPLALVLSASVSMAALLVAASMGSALAQTCVPTGDMTELACDSTGIDYRLGTGDMSLTVDSMTTGRLTLVPTSTASGPIDATLNIVGTTKINRPDDAAVWFNTDQTGRDQVTMSVSTGPDVEITSEGRFGAIFMNNRGTGSVSLETAATVLAKGDEQNGIWMRSGEGQILLNNSGDVTSENARGLYADGNGLANTPGGGGIAPADIRITNSGSVKSATNGIRAANWLGFSGIENSGTVDALRNQALVTWSNKGTSSITNSGSVISRDNHAIQAIASDGPAIIVNSGSATSRNNPDEQNETTGQHGLFARANAVGDVSITNTAQGKVDSIEAGIRGEVRESGDVEIGQAGQVIAAQQGIQALTADGTITVTNSGKVTAAGAGVDMDGSTNALINSGTVISSSATDGAIVAGDGDTTIRNSGTITNTGGAGAIAFGNGTNRLTVDAATSVINGTVQGGTGTDHLVLEATTTADMPELSIGEAGQFRGFESVEKTGEGVLSVMADAAGFSGTTTVTGGSMRVNGTLGNAQSAITVGAAGTLGGAGTIGGDAVFSGTVTPGNSIGTLTFGGNVDFAAGSTIEIEIAPDGSSDLLDVGGMATIAEDGTTLFVAGLPGEFPVNSPNYTVLSASGGLTGRFGAVQDQLPDLKIEARYTDNDVQLHYVRATADPSPKSIQASALGGGMQAGTAFGTTMIQRGRLVAAQLGGNGGNSALLGFTEEPVGEAGPFATAMPETQPAAPSTTQAPAPGWAAWGALSGSDLTVDANGGMQGWSASGAGIAAGFERRFEGVNPAMAGVAVGYTRSWVDSGNSTAVIDSYQIGTYGAVEAGDLTLSAAIAYDWQDYALERAFAAGGGPVAAEGETSGYALTGALEAFYDISPLIGSGSGSEAGLRFGPLGTLEAAHTRQSGYTETGAGILNLTVADSSADQFVAGLGAGFVLDRVVGGSRLSLDGRVTWEHVLGDRSITTSSAIPSVPGAFLSTSSPIAANRLAIGTGAVVSFTETWSTELRYEGALSSSGADHRGSVGLKARF